MNDICCLGLPTAESSFLPVRRKRQRLPLAPHLLLPRFLRPSLCCWPWQRALVLRVPAWPHPVAAPVRAWRWWLRRVPQPQLVAQVLWMTVPPSAVSARSQATWLCATSASSASTWTATCLPCRTCQGTRLGSDKGLGCACPVLFLALLLFLILEGLGCARLCYFFFF